MIQKKATQVPPLLTRTDPDSNPIPFILHLPHSGTFIPEDIYAILDPVKRDELDETDWYLDRLYDFCPELGVTVVKANYHRWVTDLNRDPAGDPLYGDGRVITGVVPTTDFNGESLYITAPSGQDVEFRIKKYHKAYFEQLQGIITEFQRRFGTVVLWDGHSIRRKVPGISKNPFPDLILGTDHDRTIRSDWQEAIRYSLSSGIYEFAENQPFRGGHITRSLARPDKGIHTVQLEMCKDLYMDDSETEYHEDRANAVRELFQDTFKQLISKICQD